MTTATAPTLAGHLAAHLDIGTPDVAGPLAVFPVFGPTPRLRYNAFAQVAGRGVDVRELEHASVNDLLVDNRTVEPVLLYDGQEVAGAQQDRTFDLSVLVAPRTTMQVPVSCVEHGRWDGGRHAEPFAPAPQTASPELRRVKQQRVHQHLLRGLDARADQGEVWSMVERKHARMGVASATGAMADGFRHHGGRVDALAEAVRPRAGQVGMLAAVGGRFTVLDHASDPVAFAALHAPLVRGYALDALEHDGVASGEAPSRAAAERFVRRCVVARVTERDAHGMGVEARFVARGVAGTGLVVEGELVQLTAHAS